MKDSIEMNMEIFQIEFDGHILVGDFIGKELPSQVLVLHGAGEAHRRKMFPLREELLQNRIGSCAFDFLGHGDSGGDLKKQSLASRTDQASAVIDTLGLARNRPLRVLAASMSGHIACRLLERYPIDRLVFVVPAMYNRNAYNVPFDSGFSAIIRIPMSWRDSEGWGILSTFCGKMLIVEAEKDSVIPREVIEKYYESAKRASFRCIYTAPLVGHKVFTELRERHPKEMNLLVEKMVAVLG